MAAETDRNSTFDDKDSPSNPSDTLPAHLSMTREEHEVATAAARFGYGPLAKVNPTEARLPPFGGEFQPGLYKPVERRKFANPAPLGLCAFALTTFVLSAINMGARDITEPNIVVGLAFAYGGLVQLLAGMWYVSPTRLISSYPYSPGRIANISSLHREMAVGNTFGATALSSYGGFWISFAVILTPGGFQIQQQLSGVDPGMFPASMGLYLMVSLFFRFVFVDPR